MCYSFSINNKENCMVRDIVKDTFILSRISVLANKDDLSIAQDLIDTLEAH